MIDTQKKAGLPCLGQRIECLGHIGTIKYIGEVDGHSGTWLGIDWDDPVRGKHDGSVKSVRYFKSSHEKSGSFVRPEKIRIGQNIISAITSRYGQHDDESTMKSNQQMLLCLQQTINASLFEMVGFEKITNKQANYANLTIINVCSNNVSTIGEPYELKQLCPNIVHLNISKNLINSWSDVFRLCGQLDKLRLLDVSANKLTIPDDFDDYRFENVESLVCTSMGLNWSDIIKLCRVFPNLTEIIAGSNSISNLDILDDGVFQRLQLIDLENNALNGWEEVCKLGNLPALETMHLNEIGLKEIWFGDVGKTELFTSLKSLYLSNNLINNWESIGELNKLQNFESLRVTKNPIFETDTFQNCQQIIIARIGNLKLLNGSNIQEDRKGAEYDYIKKYGLQWLQVKNGDAEKAAFLKGHNRYLELIEKHGDLEESELKVQVNTIQVSLVQIEFVHEDKTIMKKLPPTMLIQKLVMLAQRLFRLAVRPQLVYVSKANKLIEIDLDDEFKELGVYSIQNDDRIMVKS